MQIIVLVQMSYCFRYLHCFYYPEAFICSIKFIANLFWPFWFTCSPPLFKCPNFILLLSIKSCPLFRDKLFSSAFSVSILVFNSGLSDLRIIPENVILYQSAYTLLISLKFSINSSILSFSILFTPAWTITSSELCCISLSMISNSLWTLSLPCDLTLISFLLDILVWSIPCNWESPTVVFVSF